MRKILVVTIDGSATDRRSWSGIPFSLYEQIKDRYSIDTLAISKYCSVLGTLSAAYTRYVRRAFISVMGTKGFAKKASRLLQEKIDQNDYECVIVFGIFGAAAIAELNVKVPVILMTDCLYSKAINYYWPVVKKDVEKVMNEIQQKAFDKTTKVVLTSDWAIQSALTDYSISAEKIELIHFGANVDTTEFKTQEHEGINLLFVGIDGIRKGVDVAIECVKCLNQMDPETKYQLNVVGCNPECDDPAVHVHGFLNRNNPAERDKLENLRAISDFFIMPTRAEAAGIVFCEADAYSLPSISYRTGGVPDYVLDGENGILLDLSCSGRDFAEKILDTLKDRDQLEKMKKKAHDLYCEEYNWKKAGDSLSKVIEDVVK